MNTPKIETQKSDAKLEWTTPELTCASKMNEAGMKNVTSAEDAFLPIGTVGGMAS